MTQRRCGQTGPLISPLTLGLMVRDCKPGEAFDSVRRTVLRAVELGITSIDMATGYGGGAVEQAFGDILANDLNGKRDSLFIATKAGWADGSRKTLTESLERSLKQLRVGHVDLYYHHAPDEKTPFDETVAAMESLVRHGMTRYVGVSNYSLEQTVRIAPLFQQAGVPLIAHQCNYNMLNRWVEDGLLAALPGLGMSACVFSALNQGLLSDAGANGPRAGSRAAKSLDAIVNGVPTGEPAYGRYPAGDVRTHVLTMLRELSRIAKDRGQSLEQLALAWVLRHDAVATALVGLSSVEQVEAAAATMAHPDFTDEERLRINAVLPPRFGMR
ncbi:MAG: aldo/keto reductase [Planctomycetes bacterium]|nr:aldo/keto reductase [Planctomycetota bacterium]